ncbi:MAG TPA: PP2C family protein-serine/threonine phosphatase [Kineosporiaceae bacterium]
MTATGVPATRAGERRAASARRPRPRSAAATLTRWWPHRLGPGRFAFGQPGLLVTLTLVAASYTVGAVEAPNWFPVATATLWLMLGGFVLRVRYLLAYDLVVAAAVSVGITLRNAAAPMPGVLVTLALAAVLVLIYARSRERIGIQGSLGESMLVDLRDRLLAQGQVPALDPGWRVDSVLRAAYGDSFSGDFLVAARSGHSLGPAVARPGHGPDHPADPGEAHLLELVLVDVSGKGQSAGTRALMLSGAFGGLLGAMPPQEFLPAANRYLLRQGWDEGFATALHVALDQRTGVYQACAAGHPPLVHYHSGSGAWEVVTDGNGPLLGVLDDPVFPRHTGVLTPGDALLLYTDGLVERRGADIGLGIDRLLGSAEHVVTHRFAGGAARVLDGTRVGEADDRALVLLWRSP